MPTAKLYTDITQIQIITLRVVSLTLIMSSLLYADEQSKDVRTDLGLVEHEEIREASGIVASRKNSGVLWTHNDSDNPN